MIACVRFGSTTFFLLLRLQSAHSHSLYPSAGQLQFLFWINSNLLCDQYYDSDILLWFFENNVCVRIMNFHFPLSTSSHRSSNKSKSLNGMRKFCSFFHSFVSTWSLNNIFVFTGFPSVTIEHVTICYVTYMTSCMNLQLMLNQWNIQCGIPNSSSQIPQANDVTVSQLTNDKLIVKCVANTLKYANA